VGDNETSTTIQTVDKPFLKIYFSCKKKKTRWKGGHNMVQIQLFLCEMCKKKVFEMCKQRSVLTYL